MHLWFHYRDLSGNSFGGPIPTQLASLKNLTFLDLADNSFDGPISTQLNSLVNLVKLDLSNNDFSGPLPDKLENLVLLEYLNVRGNNLSGRIPDFTGQLQNLKYLTLRNCSLAGPIPDIIWNLRGLYLLFLRGNKLNGTIPTWIINSTMNMNFFSSLNSSDDGNELKNFNIENEAGGVNKAYTKQIGNVTVNNSRLEIHLYWSGKGSMMYQAKERSLSPPKMAAISLSVLILLIALIVYFWKMEDNSHEGMVELYPGGLYNFQKVKVAAKHFKHKLGKGAFGTSYEATLGNGMVVVVEKVSATKDIIRAFREKDSTISLMEHPNLVKLMGCIAEKNQLLLIYEDIGHNSLQNALFDSDRSRLDWTKRRNICLGVAEGLAFLHEGKQKHVHGNIKPTTIFLDKQDNAKISDFGFSRLHDQGKSREEGTVTGADTEYLPDLVAREKQREGHFMNVVDKSISNTVDWNEADTMLELALMCLDQYPDQRPTMSQVVKVLKEQLPLKDVKESLKQLSSVRDPQPHGEISTIEHSTHHSKFRSTSRGGMMTDTSTGSNNA
nr:probable LRR receptor-like serine/threonine-protein kinase At1g53430 [Ipomoea batatas]